MTARVIAEAGTCNHSLDYAHQAVDAIAATGAWAMKVQLLQADTITSRAALPYGKGLKEASSQHEAFSGALRYPAWTEIKDHCDEVGLEWFASCWDHDAVDACMSLGVNWFKVGSADITHESLLRYIGETGIPVMLSTGGATLDEISRALEWIGHFSVVPFVCTLSYPCPRGEANLRRLMWWQTQGWHVWYSDHTEGLDTICVASMLGASYVEKHVTLTPGEGGDHDFAISMDQLEWVCERLPDLGITSGVFLRADGLLGDGRIRRLECERDAVRWARRSWHSLHGV